MNEGSGGEPGYFDLAMLQRDWQVHVQAIQKLIGGGVTHIFVHSPQPDQRRVIDFYCREVLPRLH